jgi:hypothetical protein
MVGAMTDAAVIERSDQPRRDTGPVAEVAASPWRIELGPALRRAGRRLAAVPVRSWVTFLVVASCAGFVFHTVHPDLVFRNTTPTGGDMGAHVWGPRYLRDHLLTHGRVSGWTPDWYAGFPAYQFYMVLPSLFVVVLALGPSSAFVAVALVLILLAVAVSGWVVPALHRGRVVIAAAAGVAAVVALPIPYNVAFKLVTVSGLVALPIACWAFGRLSGLPFPGPPILAVASLFFIYNREPVLNSGTGNIIGGNMASTMAGEFAFSISLAFCVLYLGLLARGMRTGRNRAAAAAVLALCGLCHLIPAFFALGATAIALVVWPGRARLKWLLPTLPVAGMVSAFWVLPFLSRHAWVNDMGWEKLPSGNAMLLDAKTPQHLWHYYLGQSNPGGTKALLWPLALAAVGLVVSLVYRFRPGFLLAGALAASGVAFAVMPQARLWNARVLPFYFLCTFLLAGLGVSEVVRSVATLLARDPERPGPAVGAAGAVLVLAGTLVFLGVPLGRLPGVEYPATGGVSWLGMHRSYRNDVPSWARWNYTGLEGKEPANGPGQKAPQGQGGWPELEAMFTTMGGLGNDPAHGCGRAFWEYGDRLETYGTPMAPMLLPYFTGGCIGSMEGLYFESSATTPYHFLSQCELSDKGSCAQRDLAYHPREFNLGIEQLQLLGVRYYMAFTPWAVSQADINDALTPVATSGPWHIYQLDAEASALVTPLRYTPVVMTNVNDSQSSWLDPSAAWFLDPNRWDVPLATHGPDDWPRVTMPADPVSQEDGAKRAVGSRSLPVVQKKPVTPATVTDIETGDDHISFDVDRVGSPVLVKVSDFPNWQASGADGPYRVTPNLMVVVPTDRHVRLHFGRTSVDYLAILLTGLGLLGLVGLAMAPAVVMPEPRRRTRRPAPPGPGLAPEAPPGWGGAVPVQMPVYPPPAEPPPPPVAPPPLEPPPPP